MPGQSRPLPWFQWVGGKSLSFQSQDAPSVHFRIRSCTLFVAKNGVRLTIRVALSPSQERPCRPVLAPKKPGRKPRLAARKPKPTELRKCSEPFPAAPAISSQFYNHFIGRARHESRNQILWLHRRSKSSAGHCFRGPTAPSGRGKNVG